MERFVIINGDDFGMRQEVNEAIRKAHTKGVLTSATIMANMPAAEEAVKIAKELPDLGVGVHLNVSRGRSLCQEPAAKLLVDDNGRFRYSQFKLLALATASYSIRKAILAEFGSQIQWVIDKGIRPTHLDSHYHIHTFPMIFSIVCSLASRFRIKAIRRPYEPKAVSGLPWPISSDKGKNRAKIYRTLASVNRFQNSDFIRNEAFIGIAHTGRIDVNFFKAAALYSYAPVTEVMTHPAVNSGAFEKETGLQREAELKALCDERTRRYFADADVNLVHYGQLRG